MITFLAAIWSFLKSPIGPWIAVAATVGVLLFAVRAEGFRDGQEAERAVQEGRVKAAMERVTKIEAQAARISQAARANSDAQNAKIAALTADLKSKVSTYVTPQADRRCVIPAGYVRLRDAAGAGVPVAPAASGGPVDANSGLALSDLAANDVHNAGEFNRCVAEVKTWRGFWPDLVKTMDVGRK